MKVKKIIQALDERFPLHLQERYDNTGEQISFVDNNIENILLSLDLDAYVIDEAIEKGCNIIISHHPFFFKPLRKIRSPEPRSDLLLKLIDKRISLYSAHTNLDKIYFDKLGDVIGIINRKLLIKSNDSGNTEALDYGFGMYGELSKKATLEEFLKIVKDKLKLEFIVYSGNRNKSISKVALINGAGGGLIEKILREYTPECIVTGDVGYHHCKCALEYDVPVIDAGHFGTERILLDFLKVEVQDCLTKEETNKDVKVYISKKEENPFKVII